MYHIGYPWGGAGPLRSVRFPYTPPPTPSGSMLPPYPTSGGISGIPGALTAQPGVVPSPPEPPVGTPGTPIPSVVPGSFQESYIENILRLNLGKMVTVYMTFENNQEWNAKIFRGRLEAAGRDHIIISDPKTGERYLLLMVNLDYVKFDEELNYIFPERVP